MTIPDPTPEQIRDALKKVREERERAESLLLSGGAEDPKVPPTLKFEQLLRTIGADKLAPSPGFCMVFTDCVFRLGRGKQKIAILAKRWNLSPKETEKVLIEGIYDGGWLSQVLFGERASLYRAYRRLQLMRQPFNREA